MKKYILFLSLFCLACLVWQCGNDGDNGGNVQPAQPDTTPTIASFSPTSAGVGATVTITGTNFSTTASSNVVKFNGTTATVTNATATSLTTTVPVGATTGKITLEVAGKTATSTSDFTFIPYSTITIFAGSGASGTADGTGTAARFSNPLNIARDAQGNLYVTDNSNHTIRKITSEGVVTTFAGTAGQSGDTDGTGSAARFNGPTDICIDASGNLFVTESLANRVRKITPQGVVTVFAGSATGVSGYADATGTNARFNAPSAITIDAQGNLYVYDSANTKIRKITPAGVVTTLGSFSSANDLYMSPQGTLYISWNSAIGKVATTGLNTGVTTLWVGSNNTTGFADGAAADARFNYILGMSADADGNLYVTDRENRRIRKITPTGAVSTFAGNGTQGLANGAITQATFTRPIGISVSSANIFLVEGNGAHLIRKIE
jgi:sugar lactone lactonase YvrE